MSGKDCRKKVDRSTKGGGGGKNGQKLPEKGKNPRKQTAFFLADSNSLDGNVATHPDIFGCAFFFLDEKHCKFYLDKMMNIDQPLRAKCVFKLNQPAQVLEAWLIYGSGPG